MYIIMCARSETASCPQHTPGMYASTASVGRHMQEVGLKGGISKGVTKLVKA